MAGSSERKLSVALDALRKALDAMGTPWMCIGGIAVIAQGVRRTTTDIDVALRAEGVVLEDLAGRLARRGIRPRIDDALTFARRTQVLLLEHAKTGVELDLSLAWLSFEHEALARATVVDFGSVQAPAARPEDLVIYKLFAGRPQDLKDAEALLLMHRPNIDLVRVRRVLAQLGQMADAPEVVERIDDLETRSLGQSRAHRPKSRRKKVRR